MTLSAAELERVVDELSVLAGARVQRVDVVAEREIVLEVRCPGRTVRVLLSARPGVGRVHTVAKRPPREVPGGGLQATLRKRLQGRTLRSLRVEGRTVTVGTEDALLAVRIDGGRDAFRLDAHRDAKGGDGSADRSTGAEDVGGDPIPERFEVAESIAARYEADLPELRARALRDRLTRVLKGRVKKARRLRDKVRRDRDRLAALEAAQMEGELLKSALHAVPKGAAEVTVTDWTSGEPRTIPLEPALSPLANMERLFARAKKGARGRPRAEARLARVDAELAEIEAELARVRDAEPADLLEVAREVSDGELHGVDPKALEPRRARKNAGAKKPIDQWARRFEAVDGTEIRVGKGAKENDRLTLSAARGDDVWLHARGTSGAHVLIRNDKGRTVSQDALLDGAHLAAYHSSARGEAKVEVVYTEARNVKKTKGAPPGRVGVSKGKTLLVSVDPARLDRLLGREPPA